MSAEWVRQGDRIYSRELIEKHGGGLAGLLAEPLPDLRRMMWDPPTAILFTQGEMDSIVKKPGENRKATVDEIDAALGKARTPERNLIGTVKTYTATISAPLLHWYRKRDINAYTVKAFAATIAIFVIVWAVFASVGAAYADDACRASGAWVRCQGIQLKADDIEGVEVIHNGAYGQKELTVRYAGGTETVQVGAAHLEEALVLLDRPKPK